MYSRDLPEHPSLRETLRSGDLFRSAAQPGVPHRPALAEIYSGLAMLPLRALRSLLSR